jgi:hypothetical protein
LDKVESEEDAGCWMLDQNPTDWYTDLTDQLRIRQINQSQSVAISLIGVPIFRTLIEMLDSGFRASS